TMMTAVQAAMAYNATTAMLRCSVVRHHCGSSDKGDSNSSSLQKSFNQVHAISPELGVIQNQKLQPMPEPGKMSPDLPGLSENLHGVAGNATRINRFRREYPSEAENTGASGMC
ncbi:MAG: hypothetical protein ACR2NP_05760, partial [Pirellulaceae bacterium]